MLKKELEKELNRTKLILDYAREEIKEKDKEIEFHKNNERIAIDCQNKLNEEIERLNNIINELEKYIKESCWKDDWGVESIYAKTLLNKLQELKGSGNNA